MKTEQETRNRLAKLEGHLKRAHGKEGPAAEIEREVLKEWIRELKWVLDYPQEEVESIPPQYYGTDDPEEARRIHQNVINEMEKRYRGYKI